MSLYRDDSKAWQVTMDAIYKDKYGSHTCIDLFVHHMARACMVMQVVAQGTVRETSYKNVATS